MDKEGIFRFKHFALHHSRSSMKIGVDGVLIGAWGNVRRHVSADIPSILDIGCGCGLVALMSAQRNPSAKVTAIDIDPDSVEETKRNISESPFAGRVEAWKISIEDFAGEIDNHGRFDCILSNPPFFSAGINPVSAREKARHTAELSPVSLMKFSVRLLKLGGCLSFISCSSDAEAIFREGKNCGLRLSRKCVVANSPNHECGRVMFEFVKIDGGYADYQGNMKEEKLFVRNETGEYSDEYKSLTSDFYLAF